MLENENLRTKPFSLLERMQEKLTNPLFLEELWYGITLDKEILRDEYKQNPNDFPQIVTYFLRGETRESILSEDSVLYEILKQADPLLTMPMIRSFLEHHVIDMFLKNTNSKEILKNVSQAYPTQSKELFSLIKDRKPGLKKYLPQEKGIGSQFLDFASMLKGVLSGSKNTERISVGSPSRFDD